jgi:hypothetical protein
VEHAAERVFDDGAAYEMTAFEEGLLIRKFGYIFGGIAVGVEPAFLLLWRGSLRREDPEAVAEEVTICDGREYAGVPEPAGVRGDGRVPDVLPADLG